MNKIVTFHSERNWNDPYYFRKVYCDSIRDFQHLLSLKSVVLFDTTEDEEGNTLPEDEWYTHDCTGEILIKGKKAMESVVGTLDFDGEYDTYCSKYLYDCDTNELGALYDYCVKYPRYHDFDDGDYMYICEQLGYNYISSFEIADNKLIVWSNGDSDTILTEDLRASYSCAKKYFEDNYNFDALSVRKVLDFLEKEDLIF